MIPSMNTQSPAPETVVIVEDDEEIRILVADLLRQDGYNVEAAGSGAELDEVLSRVRADLLILDVMLPGEDGLAICRRIRARDGVPILMLTAKSDEIDRVLGLEMGADDYVVKPFGPRELIARVRARLRRARQGETLAHATRRFAFDNFVVDLDARHLATADGAEVVLTTAEFDLLACLVGAPRRVLSRDHIMSRVRGRSADPYDRTIDMLVSRLRRKLEAASPGTALISTVRNTGYLFTAQVRAVP